MDMDVYLIWRLCDGDRSMWYDTHDVTPLADEQSYIEWRMTTSCLSYIRSYDEDISVYIICIGSMH